MSMLEMFEALIVAFLPDHWRLRKGEATSLPGTEFGHGQR